MICRIGALIVLLVGVTATAQPARSVAPATQGDSLSDAPDYLVRGLAELKAGRPREAQAIFMQGLALYEGGPAGRLDSDTQINLYHGLAVAQARSNQLAQARQTMDRLRNATKTNASIQFNDAWLDVQTRTSVPRGVATVEKVLAAGPVNEDSVNLFGFGITKLEADPSARSRVATLWQSYDKYEQRLTPPSPGVRHWGSSWIPQAQMQQIQTDRTTATKRKDQLTQRIKTLGTELPAAQQTATARQADLDLAKQRTARPVVVARLSRLAEDAKLNAQKLETELQQANTELPKLGDGPKPTFTSPGPADPVTELATK